MLHFPKPKYPVWGFDAPNPDLVKIVIDLSRPSTSAPHPPPSSPPSTGVDVDLKQPSGEAPTVAEVKEQSEQGQAPILVEMKEPDEKASLINSNEESGHLTLSGPGYKDDWRVSGFAPLLVSWSYQVRFDTTYYVLTSNVAKWESGIWVRPRPSTLDLVHRRNSLDCDGVGAHAEQCHKVKFWNMGWSTSSDPHFIIYLLWTYITESAEQSTFTLSPNSLRNRPQ